MGLCVNCIYHSNQERFVTKVVNGINTTIKITHLCTHPDNKKVDFVTGEETFDSCYKFNGFQECLKFDDGKEEMPPAEDDNTVDNETDGGSENSNTDNSSFADNQETSSTDSNNGTGGTDETE